MSQGHLQSVTKRYRSELAAHEAAAEHALREMHAHMLHAIQPHLNTLYRHIEAKQQTSEDGKISLVFLYENHRLRELQHHITQTVDIFGAQTHVTALQVQHTGVQLGSQAAQAQLTALDIPMPKVAPPASLAKLTDTATVVSRTAGYGAEAAKKVGGVLHLALSLGQKVGQIAQQIGQALLTPLYRALAVVGDVFIDAFRDTSIEYFRANSETVIGWAWMADLMGEPEPCAACIAEHGSIHPLDEDMNSHNKCRCVQEPVTANSPDIQSGADWFDEQDAETQRDIVGSQIGYDLINSGDAELSDFVGYSDDGSIYQRSVKQITGKR